MSSLEDRLDSTSEPWKPNEGDKLIGTVVDIDERDGGYGSYPIIVVLTDSGDQLAFHAFHTVAKSELAKARPVVGDRIGVKYLGKPEGKNYESYRITVARDDGRQQLDWDRIGAEAEAEAPGERYVHSDDSGDVLVDEVPDAIAAEQAQKEVDDDDIPF